MLVVGMRGTEVSGLHIVTGKPTTNVPNMLRLVYHEIFVNREKNLGMEKKGGCFGVGDIRICVFSNEECSLS